MSSSTSRHRSSGHSSKSHGSSSKGKDKGKGSSSSGGSGGGRGRGSKGGSTNPPSPPRVDIAVQPPFQTRAGEQIGTTIVAKLSGAICEDGDTGFSRFIASAYACDALGTMLTGDKILDGNANSSGEVYMYDDGSSQSSGRASRATEVTLGVADLYFPFPGLTVPAAGVHTILVRVGIMHMGPEGMEFEMLGQAFTRAFENMASDEEIADPAPSTLHVPPSQLSHLLISFLSRR